MRNRVIWFCCLCLLSLTAHMESALAATWSDLEAIRAAAEWGDPDAQCDLGEAYANGDLQGGRLK